MGSYGVDGKSLQYQRTDGCDNVGHLMMVMDGLASFHARWWGFNNSKKPLKWAGHPLRSLGGLVRTSFDAPPFHLMGLGGTRPLPAPARPLSLLIRCATPSRSSLSMA